MVSPEYNHGYSAVLKNALDYAYSPVVLYVTDSNSVAAAVKDSPCQARWLCPGARIAEPSGVGGSVLRRLVRGSAYRKHQVNGVLAHRE
jgi:NADPH-dependent FMN reductase